MSAPVTIPGNPSTIPAAPAAAPGTPVVKPGQPAPPAAPAAPAVPPKPAAAAWDPIMERDRKLTAREKAFATKEAALQRFEQAQAKFKDNPLAFIESMGMDFNTLAKYVLTNGTEKPKGDPLKELLDRQQRVERQIQERERREAQAAYDQSVQSFRGELVGFISENRDKYPVMAKLGEEAHDELLAACMEYVQATTERDAQGRVLVPGQLPDLDTACRLMEDAFRERAKLYSEAAAPVAPQPPGAPQKAPPVPPQKRGMAIDSSMAGSVSPGAATPPKKETDAERRKRIARETGLIR